MSEDNIVLHYAFSYLSDVTAKSARSCPERYIAAAKAGDLHKVCHLSHLSVIRNFCFFFVI